MSSDDWFGEEIAESYDADTAEMSEPTSKVPVVAPRWPNRNAPHTKKGKGR